MTSARRARVAVAAAVAAGSGRGGNGAASASATGATPKRGARGMSASLSAASAASCSTSTCSSAKPKPPSNMYDETSSAPDATPTTACVRGGNACHGGGAPARALLAPEASWHSSRTRYALSALGLAARTW